MGLSDRDGDLGTLLLTPALLASNDRGNIMRSDHNFYNFRYENTSWALLTLLIHVAE